MTTENLKVNDVIVGNDGMGDRIGYYKESKTDKQGIWISYSTSKSGSGGVYVRSIKHVRLATPEEVTEFEA